MIVFVLNVNESYRFDKCLRGTVSVTKCCKAELHNNCFHYCIR